MTARRAAERPRRAGLRGWLAGIRRWARFKLLQLLRAPGGPTFVATGFAVGFFCEMFTLPTYGLAFFLIFPLIYVLRGSLAGALVGFVLGKVVYLPLAYLHSVVGGWVLPTRLSFHLPLIGEEINRMLLLNLKLIVGGMVDGLWIGAVLFIAMRSLLLYLAAQRKERRRLRRRPGAAAEPDIARG
ncbi:DUF2062 domain-containing protein [Paenibacillus sp. FSL W8-1187]|uniref:DUF2062 domain-containing protein n=1 Tax=Paenibacillus pasadenensis TaxID=217090 RepID=A0A2N5NA01_9BACL|nr:DUF2062 domain-containing protein [Paenibacillus pasadenensis]PLT47186.1 hypothetical protein B8V81_1410 [Paenibacillus pasadenensis]